MFLGDKGLPERKADNLPDIFVPIIRKISEPRHLTILLTSRARYIDTFIC
jgi:hypothetical protein